VSTLDMTHRRAGAAAGETLVLPASPIGRVAPATAGPAAIVASALLASAPFLLGQTFPIQYDILAQWLPTFSFLGKSLGSGHIPAWNPDVMGGIPFAADPQTGWLNLPAMLLFGSLGSGTALRLYMALQPVLAGLGLYAFLRAESLTRSAATAGGLIVALAMVGSRYFALPWLSAATAWAALTLAAAAHYLNSASWRARLLWLAAAALAWGQVAAAHLSDGLVVATGALVAYIAGRTFSDLRSGRRSRRESGAMLGLLVAGFALLNLAYFLPRIQYLPATTLGKGYAWMDQESRRLTGSEGYALRSGTDARWPLAISLSPGLFVGATASMLLIAGGGSRPRRRLFASFAAFGALCYLLTLQPAAGFVGPHLVPSGTMRDCYLHSPFGVAGGWPLILGVLAAVGLDAWSERRSARRRMLLVMTALAAFGVLPLAFWGGGHLAPFAAGAAAGTAALALVAARRAPPVVLAAVVAVELLVNAVAAWVPVPAPAEQPPTAPLLPLSPRTFDLASYSREGPIVRALRARAGEGERYISIADRGVGRFGSVALQQPGDLPLLGLQQSMVFGLEEAQGYNSVQLTRYWEFLRASDPERRQYSAAFFVRPPPIALDLLGVGWIISPAGVAPPVAGAVPTARDGAWELFRLPGGPPRATVVQTWTVAQTPGEALRRVLRPGFDPGRVVVLERAPHPGGSPRPAAAPASASYRALGPDSARIDVSAPGPAIVLLRNTYESHWQATVDGRRATVVPADYIDQGVAIARGRHTIVLRYRDGAIRSGLLASGISLALLLVAVLILWARGFRPALEREPPPHWIYPRLSADRRRAEVEPPTE
jgi:hypothetical protein